MYVLPPINMMWVFGSLFVFLILFYNDYETCYVLCVGGYGLIVMGDFLESSEFLL